MYGVRSVCRNSPSTLPTSFTSAPLRASVAVDDHLSDAHDPVTLAEACLHHLGNRAFLAVISRGYGGDGFVHFGIELFAALAVAFDAELLQLLLEVSRASLKPSVIASRLLSAASSALWIARARAADTRRPAVTAGSRPP